MVYRRSLSNVVGFDDGPFDKDVRETSVDVPLVGAVCAGVRLDMIVRGAVKRNGDDATAVMERLLRQPGLEHVRGVMMKGITCGGFNVVDIHALHERLGLPVLVVMRRPPHYDGFFHALTHVADADQKRALVEKAGAPEPEGKLWVQRAGLSGAEARRMLEKTTVHGALPEPLRLAHIIAGGMTTGRSRGNA